MCKAINLGKLVSSGLRLTDYEALLNDGRNIELVIRLLANLPEHKNWLVVKDDNCPQRTVVIIDGEKYYLRYKTKNGFNLAPSKMKGTQRVINDKEANNFANNNKFILIEYNNGDIKYRLISSPSKYKFTDIDSDI